MNETHITIPVPNLSVLKREPAAILLTLNALLAVFLAWGASAQYSSRTVGIVLTVSTAVIALLVALLTRPPSVALLKGGVAALLVAFASFGVHLSPATVAGAAAVGSVLLGLLLRANLTPVTTPVPATPVVPVDRPMVVPPGGAAL